MNSRKLPDKGGILSSSSLGLWFAVVCGLCFAPAVIFGYAYWDDFGNFLYFHEGWANWRNTGFTRDGRILHSILLYAGFINTESLADLRYLRLISLLGIVGFAWVLHREVLRVGYSRSTSLLIAGFCVLSPAMAVNAGWTNNFPYSWAMIPVVLASSYCIRRDWRLDLGLLLAALAVLALLIFIQFIYQPLIGVFVLLPLLNTLRMARLRASLISCGILFVCYGLSYALYKCLPLLDPTWGISDRATLNLNPFEQLPLLLKLFPMVASSWFGVIGGASFDWPVLLISLPLVILAFRQVFAAQRRMFGLSLALSAIILSAPWLFVLEDIFTYRIQYGFYCCWFALIAVGISHLPWGGWRRAKDSMNVLLLTACVLASCYALTFGIALYAKREMERIRAALAPFAGEKGVQVVLWDLYHARPAWSSFERRADFAVPSTLGAGHFMVDVIAREIWPTLKDIHLLYVTRDTVNLEIPLPLIDMEAVLFQEPRPLTSTGSLGAPLPLQQLAAAGIETNGRWMQHSILGLVFQSGPHYFYSPSQGSIWSWVDEETGSRAFYTHALGIFQFTSPDESTIRTGHRTGRFIKDGDSATFVWDRADDT